MIEEAIKIITKVKKENEDNIIFKKVCNFFLDKFNIWINDPDTITGDVVSLIEDVKWDGDFLTTLLDTSDIKNFFSKNFDDVFKILIDYSDDLVDMGLDVDFDAFDMVRKSIILCINSFDYLIE